MLPQAIGINAMTSSLRDHNAHITALKKSQETFLYQSAALEDMEHDIHQRLLWLGGTSKGMQAAAVQFQTLSAGRMHAVDEDRRMAVLVLGVLQGVVRFEEFRAQFADSQGLNELALRKVR